MSAISIYAEASPNPESMKFVLNSTLLPDGVSVDYPNVEAAVNSPVICPARFSADAVPSVPKPNTPTVEPLLTAVDDKFREDQVVVFEWMWVRVSLPPPRSLGLVVPIPTLPLAVKRTFSLAERVIDVDIRRLKRMPGEKKVVRLLPNDQLRWERQRRGWSRAYIAEQIGVADPKTIGRWERGGAFPSAYFLQRLCALFQMPAEELGLWYGRVVVDYDAAERD